MPDLRQITRSHMKALIDHYGCYDAVAETINARWGGGASKGAISKKVSGNAEFTLADAIALEDASGRYPVTRQMARRLEAHSEADNLSLVAHSGIIAKECGEAINAILSAEQSCCADERADAVQEIDEAMAALRAARAKIENRNG